MKIKFSSSWSSVLSAFSVDELNFEEARKRLLFGVFCVFSSAMLLAFGLYHVLLEQAIEGVFNIVAAGLLLSFAYFVRGQRDARAFYRAPGIIIGLLFVYFATLGDPEGYRMLWLYAYPVMVLFLVGSKEGLVYVAAVTLAWVVALLVPSSVSGPEVYDSAFTVRFLTSYGLVVAASWFLESVRQHYAESQRLQSVELERDRTQMHDLAYSDDLTRLPNRRSALLTLDDTLAAMSFDDSKSALVAMLDIDRFKVVNDHFGHAIGDQVLRSVAKRVRNAIRSNDFVGRYGGEEFLFVIPGAKKEQYQVILEKIRLAVCKRPISLEGVLHHVTVSVGGTDVKRESSREKIIEQADHALYVAKTSGRNQCVLYKPGLGHDQSSETIAS